MIEILLNEGVWVSVFSDANLTTNELVQIANDSGLVAGANHTALMPNKTQIDCAQVVAFRAQQ